MIKNYLKTAWRNLVKNKVYSALNILGLAAGMGVAMLIGLWVYYHTSYDKFLPGYERAYKAMIKYVDNGEVRVGPATPMPLADALMKDVPGVKYVAQTDWIGNHGLVAGEKKIYLNGAMAGDDFLKIFQYPLLKGEAEKVLEDPYSIVLTESAAESLFGDDNPLDKTVRLDNQYDLKVTGVLKNLPSNSTLKFKFLVPFTFFKKNYAWVADAEGKWGNNSFQTFLTLEKNASYKQADAALKLLIKRYFPEDYAGYKSEIVIHPMSKWHLFSDFKNGIASGGFIEYIKMFSVIGILVLLIACINFMNLSTARSEKRAREVGVRKVVGSQKRDIILQFLIESLVITVIAGLLALLIVYLVLPAFNMLTSSAIRIPFENGIFWIVTIAYVTITGLLAGSRPAFYLSSFRPVKVLKGTLQVGKTASLPRKILVVLQFTCSIALIISTIIIYQQIHHAKNRSIGYDPNRLMMTDASNDLNKNYTALKDELVKTGFVAGVTRSSNPITDIWSNNDIDDWPGKRPGETLGLATIGICDANYFETMGISLKEGNNFNGNLGADSLCVILSEAAVKRMRLKEPINQAILWAGSTQRLRIIGVVKDALMRSPFSPAEPTAFIYTPGWSNTITYRLNANAKTQDAIAVITAVFNKYNPAYPYLYRFVDEAYASKFTTEVLIGKLSGLFAALAVLISCLGLFGLAAFMAQQRNKEIGIRKVLGASVSHVWLLLSKEFILLVTISCVIASPIAFYFLSEWLQKYSYRIDIGFSVFIISATAAIGITILTISYQAIKAALSNPVKSLRTE